MSDYIVSARKYRPDSFETLLGQDNIAKTLKNSILRGQLAHAYLFCGPRGVGKTSTARIFAKTINCANPGPDLEPCGECESCKSFAEGRSYCIHELDAASNNGVDDIKALMDKVQIPPQVGRYSVYIIDEVHMLSQSAFNAFLKTLEEPPAHAIFILATTEKHKILPTILSRCQTYDFNRISIGDMVRNLRTIAAKEGVTVDDESLHVIARQADGAMRDALTIFDQTVAFCGTEIRCEDVMRNLNVLDYEYGFRLVDCFLAKDHAGALLLFDEVLSKGFNALHFITALSSHLRDLIVSRTAGLEALLDLPESLKERYREQSSRCELQFLYNALEATTQCEAGFRASTNQRLHIEFTLMKLCFLQGVPAGKNISSVAPGGRPVTPPATQPAPVAKPAPAAEPAPVAPSDSPVISSGAEGAVEKSPARAVKGAAALSLSSLMDESEAAAAAPVETRRHDLTPPADELLTEKWKELAAQYASQPRLSNAMLKADLVIAEEDGMKIVTFRVMNQAQQKWIQEKLLRDMEGRFRKLTDSGLVRLAVDVASDTETAEQIYMPEEKAKVLIESNKEIQDLVIDLGLDVK